MRRCLIGLSLLLLFVAATPAFADLAGATVTVNYLYPEQNDIYEVLGTGTVDAAAASPSIRLASMISPSIPTRSP